LHSYFLF